MVNIKLFDQETQKALQNYTRTAIQSRVPQDQLENFLNAGYIALPWQLKFHAAAREADNLDGPTKIGVGGARGPGKSHAVFAQVALDDLQRVPELKFLFLRQTGISARESFEDLVLRILTGRIHFSYTSGILSFSNNSRAILGGFHDEKDIEKYIGIEYDGVAIEELNQLTEDKVTKLLGSMRTAKSNWRPRLYSSFNAGGIGHQFVKETYVIPHQNATEKETRFIPATYKDNPFLNKEYNEYLESLKGTLGQAWREGNWDIFEGQFFNEWSREHHIELSFEVPPTWKRYRAYDHGRENPACCKWYTVDYDGRVHVYREFYQRGLNVDQIAERIKTFSGDEQYEWSVADPSIFAKMGIVDAYGGQTIAESFSRQGIDFMPASNRRIDGWNLLHQYLYYDKNKEPKIKYFSICKDSIQTIPRLIHDANRPEDVDTMGEDHAADTDRYFLLTLHEQKSPEPLNSVQKKLQERVHQDHPLNNEFYFGDSR